MMLKIPSFILLFCWLWININSEIITIQSFKEISTDRLKDTVIFLDINRTLIIPKEPMLCTILGRRYFLDHFPKESKKDIEKLAFFTTFLELQTIWIPVEEMIPKWVENIQKKGAKVMGVTGRGIPSGGNWPYRPEFLENESGVPEDIYKLIEKQLHQNGIYLDRSAPMSDDLKQLCLGLRAYYEDGIIFLNQQPMSNVLIPFIKALRPIPKVVICVDDELYYLQLLEKELERYSVHFIGYHYKGGAFLDKKFDPNIAAYQMNYLMQRGKLPEKKNK